MKSMTEDFVYMENWYQKNKEKGLQFFSAIPFYMSYFLELFYTAICIEQWQFF